jgi:phage FluMu gp28-like protein
MPRYTIGVDLGQVSDYTAVAVLEEGPSRHYALRHLVRLRNRPYPEIVNGIRLLVRRLPGTPALAVDATGVGRPVVDMMKEARINADLYPVTITGGDAVTRDGLEYRVPKRDLCSCVAVLLQSGRLKIAREIPYAGTLQHELIRFRVKISPDGHDSYAAWREADHDDLVLAVAVASWMSEHGQDGYLRYVRDQVEKAEAAGKAGGGT